MAERIKQPIEKYNYHDHIFETCATILKGYQGIREHLDEIIKYLNDFSDIFSHSEHELIEAFNSDYRLHRESGVLKATSKLIEELKMFFFDSNDFRTIRYFDKTYKELDKILNPVERERYRPEREREQIREQILTNIVPYPNLRGQYRDKGVMGNFKTYYRLVSSIVEDINNFDGWEHLSSYLNKTVDAEQLASSKQTVTFLSYAFKDNIYALFLYDYFKKNGGFLYVDTLFGKDYKGDGAKIKASLSPWISRASQILFLHSIKSDQGAKGLSSWCSWELGEAYSQNNKRFYKVVVAGVLKNHPIVDDTFLELKEVKNGIIIPKTK